MKKLPFFTILSVLLFLAAIAIIAFPTTTTTHIQGTAEKWDKNETYLGTCPVEINIREVKSLCFRYRARIFLSVDGHPIPALSKVRDAIYYAERKNYTDWSGFYYDPRMNDFRFVVVSYYPDIPEYEITLGDNVFGDKVYHLRDFTVS